MPASSLVTGAIAGLGATIPMTLAMEAMPRSLPQHSPRRTALMVTAHVVWGSVLGLLVDSFQERHKKYYAQSVKKDDKD